MADIAQECGVSRMTVSRILRNYPHVKQDLRARVLACAERLNYRPDPALAALSRHRHAQKKGAPRGEQLGLVVPEGEKHGWGTFPVMKELEADLRKEAARMGYRLLLTKVAQDGGTLPATLRKLRNKGIYGLVLSAPVDPERVSRDKWDDFAVVTMGLNQWEKCFHAVTISFTRMSILAAGELAKAGYRRIGYVEGTIDALSGFQPSAALHVIKRSYPGIQTDIHTLGAEDSTCKSRLESWLKTFSQDAVISIHGDPLEWIREGNRERLQPIETVLLNRPREARGISGVITPPGIYGRQCIVRLHQLLLDNEKGFPSARTILMIEGEWRKAVVAEYDSALTG